MIGLIRCLGQEKDTPTFIIMTHVVLISNPDVLYHKLAEINFLRQLHGTIILSFNVNDAGFRHVKYIFPDLQIFAPDEIKDCQSMTTTHLSRFSLDPRERKLFQPAPIRYIANGLMGDFIHSLSVVHQKFLTTGRKGIIYLSDRGSFRHGIKTAYDDTKRLLLQQPYIHDYLLYHEQPYDVDLSEWIISPRLFRCNWHELFKSCYDVEWGVSPWLSVEEKDLQWRDKVLVHSSLQRPLPVSQIDPSLWEDAVFISQDEKEWEFFKNRNHVVATHLTYYRPNSFYDMVSAIASCKLFVGSLSAPLAIAHACHTPSLTRDPKTIDSIHVRTLPNIWSHFTIIE